MSSDFYMDEGGVTAADMDPLGTAAAAQQTGTGTTGEPVIGQLKSSAGTAKKAKQPMSSKKKIAFVIGGLVAAAGVLTILGSGQPPAPKMGHPPPVPAVDPGASAAGATAGMVSAPPTGDSSTVMGSSEVQPTGAPQTPAMPTQATGPAQAMQAPGPAQGAVQAAVQPTPSNSAPAPVSKSQAGTAISAGSGQGANAAGWEQSKPASDKGTVVVPSSADNAKLAERVAELERKLAKLEHTNENRAAPSQRASTNDMAPSSHRSKVQRLARAATSAPTTPVLRSAPTIGGPAQAPQAPSLDNVHVIGITTRQGVTSALLSMGSTNKRVSEGQHVPGLGTVSKIGTDAAGNAYAEINGVTYQ